MNPLLFLRRIRHCAGFGVQSPTDYAFVRGVIYERNPYYAYDTLDKSFPSMKPLDRWQARLLLRVANHAQAEKIAVCGEALPEYAEMAIVEGCKKTRLVACNDAGSLRSLAQEDGVWIAIPYIYKDGAALWKLLTSLDNVVAFDLYYLGIAFVDKNRYAETHIINPY